MTNSNFDLDKFILEQLDQLESRPRMWAGCIEALEAKYLCLLDLLAVARGIDKRGEDKSGDHYIPLTFHTYKEVTATGSQGCIPIWRRDDQNITMEDAAKYLREVRDKVLS